VDYLPNHDFPGSQRLEDTPEIYGEIDTAMKNGIPVLTQTTEEHSTSLQMEKKSL
jgi:hypothetical protein